MYILKDKEQFVVAAVPAEMVGYVDCKTRWLFLKTPMRTGTATEIFALPFHTIVLPRKD